MIYFIEAPHKRGTGKTGAAVKIGYSASFEGVDERLRSLQAGNPNELRIVAVLPGAPADEARLHAKFGARRIRGEWFECRRPLRDLIERAARHDWHDA